jgi:broad specificity phosphatase PhoE
MMTIMDERHLYLARHGRTALNAEGRLRGLADPPLDATGVAEARRLGAALASKGLVIVVCSPLQRAAHTAQIIAEAAHVPVAVDQRFNDRDYGPWTGAVKKDVLAQWGSVDAAPGVEPVERILERALPALDALLDEHPDGAIAVVTHDAVIRPLIQALTGSTHELETPTASWNDLLRTPDGWQLLCADQKPADQKPADRESADQEPAG